VLILTIKQPLILGRDLSKILSPSGYRKLVWLAGGETVSLPNARRISRARVAKDMLRQGLSPRKVADALRLSQRYVEMLVERERRQRQLRLIS